LLFTGGSTSTTPSVNNKKRHPPPGTSQLTEYPTRVAGIQQLIVLVNKMDDKSVEWSEVRYTEIKDKLSPFLKKWGYNVARDVQYCPCSGIKGSNLKDQLTPDVCSWYKVRHIFFFIIVVFETHTHTQTLSIHSRTRALFLSSGPLVLPIVGCSPPSQAQPQ